jgi:uncharacterized SAM-binding protein YcdF (DUF218 family)
MGLVPTRWYLMLVMPSTIGMLLMAAGLLLFVRRLRRGQSGRALRAPLMTSAGGLMILYLASTPLVATMLSRSLERMTPYLAPENAPVVDAIVVLGGGQSGYQAEDGSMHLQGGRGSDRLERGIQAFKAGKAPLLVLGGGSFGLPTDMLVGEFMRRAAVECGVPPEAILACGDAKYTTDEGASIAALVEPRGVRRILLCTSATHLPRATIAYERLGFDVVGLPCDFDTRGSGERMSALLLLPRGQALSQTENAVKEWLGLSVARVQRLASDRPASRRPDERGR